ANKDIEGIKTPIGYIPYYEDLKKLFMEVLGVDYKEENYLKQFSLRVPQNIMKMERIIKIYEKEEDLPDVVLEILKKQKEELEKVKEKFGDFVSPYKFMEK
ncbi:phosphoenolpyruvate carboxykinase (GTP), partial [bacterium]|nr:phosphoenolpyruvate carboxykinase (GTP) [bacterium]